VVQNWLEARQTRGLADTGGRATGPLGLGQAAASELLGVMKQMLASINDTTAGLQAVHEGVQAGNSNLADVKSWQSKLQVVNSLHAQQDGLDELKRVKQDSAIRSKK